MKRIIRLTESDLTRIVRRVIKEQGLNPTDLNTVTTILEPEINLAKCAKKYLDLGYKIVDKIDLPDGIYLHNDEAYPDLPSFEERERDRHNSYENPDGTKKMEKPDAIKAACAGKYGVPSIYITTLEGKPTGYIASRKGARGCTNIYENKNQVQVFDGRISCGLNYFKKI